MLNDRNQTIVNCNEMIRGSLWDGWAQQASQHKCSLVSAGNGGVQVRELTTKLDVFNAIRAMSNVGWTENALRALEGWMRIGDRWNKRRFGGSGGFTTERIADNRVLGPPEHLEIGGSDVRVSGVSADSEDVNDLVKKEQLKQTSLVESAAGCCKTSRQLAIEVISKLANVCSRKICENCYCVKVNT